MNNWSALLWSLSPVPVVVAVFFSLFALMLRGARRDRRARQAGGQSDTSDLAA